MIDQILEHNKKFVLSGEYERYITDKYPSKKIAVVTCMDTRLTELLPAAMGLKNGDVNIISNAGGIVAHPLGETVRSLIVAIYELGITDIMVVGHTDCGARGLNPAEINKEFIRRGISQEKIESAQYFGSNYTRCFRGFSSVEESVSDTVVSLKKHPLIPHDIDITGYNMNTVTGELTRII